MYDLVQLELTGYVSVSCYLQRKILISLVMKESEGNRHDFKRPMGHSITELECVENPLGVLPRESLILLVQCKN